MIGFDYTITNKNGDSIILNQGSQNGNHVDPLNVYALQKYPNFSKGIKNNEIQKNGQTGVWDFFSYYSRLSINFSGIIVAEDNQKLEQMKNTMQRLFALPAQPTDIKNGYVLISWTDLDGNNKQVEGKITSDINFDRDLKEHNIMSFFISLKTKTPYVYSGGNYINVSGLRGYFNYGGIFLPTLLPISWNGSTQNILNVDNSDSTIDSPAIIKIYGESQQIITNPKVENLTTGQFIQINSSLTDETDFIIFNGVDGTITNKSGGDISGSLTSGSDFLTLSVGVNELLYTSDENPYTSLFLPTAVYEIMFLKTYDN